MINPSYRQNAMDISDMMLLKMFLWVIALAKNPNKCKSISKAIVCKKTISLALSRSPS
jgi:hypothetical protein